MKAIRANKINTITAKRMVAIVLTISLIKNLALRRNMIRDIIEYVRYITKSGIATNGR